MKIKVKRKFKYTWDNRMTHVLLPGEYDVPRNVDKDAAELALTFGAAVIIPEKIVRPVKKKPVKKKAPENKAVKVKEAK